MPQTRRIRFGAFEVDLCSSELFKHGIRIKLQDQPFQILTILLDRPGELVPREELHKKLWAEDTFVDFDAGLNAAIRRLRDALNESAEEPRYIETLPRHGYRFIADVTKVPGLIPANVETAPSNGSQTVADLLPGASLAGSAAIPSVRRRSWMPWQVMLAIAGGLALAVTLGTPTWRHRFFSAHASTGIQSIAVLPLQNLSGDASQDYFADGMTDALITELAQIKSFRVISRTSAMHYKGTQKKLSEIASELNIDAVVEGSVIRSGDRMRIDARLIRANNDQLLWAKSYDRKISDVLMLQADVAQAITGEIEVKVTPEEQSRLQAKKHEVDPKVYESYLKGRYFSHQLGGEGLKKAVGYYREAIQVDPNYAPAYSGLSDAYSTMGFGWVDVQHPELLAIEAAKKALSLDDSLAEAHASLGFVLHRHMQDWRGAEKEFKRAIELNPNYATAHQRYGVYFSTIGLQDAACDEFRTARELDPLAPGTPLGQATCARTADQIGEAVRAMKDAIEMYPSDAGSRWMLGEIYERRGMFPEALEQYQKGAAATDRNPIMLTLMASAYAGWGKTAEAQKLLREMQQRFGEDKWLSAVVYARMGRKEQAIRDLVLDSAGDCGPGKCGPGASLFVSEWRFDPLRSDPRFQELLDLYHYPQSARQK